MSRKGTSYLDIMGYTPEKYLAQVEQGMEDNEILATLDVSRTAYCNWKKKHGLTNIYNPSTNRYYHKLGQCAVTDQGFTPEDYHRLRAEKKTNSYIHTEILHVSLATWLRWKRKHGLVGDSLPEPRIDTAERVRINNEMVKQGCHINSICRMLKMKNKNSYFKWRNVTREKGYEVL